MEQREVNTMLTIQSLIIFRCMRCVMIQGCVNYCMCCNSLNLKRSLELRVIERHGYSVRFIEYWLYYACAGTVPGMIAFTLTRNSSRTVLESIALPFQNGTVLERKELFTLPLGTVLGRLEQF